ncbi:Hemolysin transporter protein ShlB precursor [Aliarcobacter thereius]|uniref:Hemolysin transporter protein ShlB n=1 Tax=Aliarcobacter thereius TaxID=544718 RepID=A0A1C0B8Z1_9BACT|nr:ShlB/FhaC/HecB family hemolysin secretion/activation protein [Aliarcobacter thereius]OCM00066.1 Hemolysin transporter protein ShlB precursor [Aliarcobacter thereius]
MRILILTIIIVNLLQAITPTDIINKQIQDLEQKRVFEEQNINRIKKSDKLFDKKNIEIEEDIDESNCIFIKEIKTNNITVFEDGYFDEIIKPYLNKCHGIRNLSNLRDKITNQYISKGYITSKAYIKAQDLNRNIFIIDILEGKIDTILSKNINNSNLYLNYNNRILNIKDLEVSIMQAERLRTQELDLQLFAGNEASYTKIYIENISEESPIYGSIGLNNFGSDYTGKYQIYNNINYENLFGISDIISLNINTTNNVLKNKNKTLGTSINYSFPIERALFELSYNYSNYKQINSDYFGNNFLSNGDNYSYGIEMDYKTFHNLNNNLSFIFSYDNKSTKNYLNDSKLDLQSYTTRPFGFGYKHSYRSESFDIYNKMVYYKGISGDKEEFAEQDKYFDKLTLDFGINKYFGIFNNLQYSSSLRAQYSNNNLFGTEEISIGGIYSVRGFNNVSLSGNKGFYLRNELIQRYDLSSIIIMPYMGFDYGYIDENEYSVSGSISGGAIGNRIYYNGINLEFFYNFPIKDTVYTKKESSDFYGVSLSYNF